MTNMMTIAKLHRTNERYWHQQPETCCTVMSYREQSWQQHPYGANTRPMTREIKESEQAHQPCRSMLAFGMSDLVPVPSCRRSSHVTCCHSYHNSHMEAPTGYKVNLYNATMTWKTEATVTAHWLVFPTWTFAISWVSALRCAIKQWFMQESRCIGNLGQETQQFNDLQWSQLQHAMSTEVVDLLSVCELKT